eukprot:2386836-Amphidinium_carterae.1
MRAWKAALKKKVNLHYADWRRSRLTSAFLPEWVAGTCAYIAERDDIFVSAWKHLTLDEDEKKL